LSCDNTRRKGADAEEMVCRHLEKNGLRILERNFAARSGEIDIIALDGESLCFIEVKSASGDFAPPEMKVNVSKQKKIIKTAQIYISKKRPSSEDFRFDVVSVTKKGIELYKDAFRT